MYQEYMTDESAKLATLHLVESAPSALREIAWIPKQEHKVRAQAHALWA